MTRGCRLITLGVGTLSLPLLLAILAVARPWLPHEENRVANGYFTHTERKVTFTWQEFPRWRYRSAPISTCGFGLAPNTPPPTAHYQTLMLGFLTIVRFEFSSTSPCGSTPVR